MGTRMGMIFSIMSFACLTGPPIAGLLVQRLNGNYLGAQIFAGSAVLAGSITLLAARVVKEGFKVMVRA